MHNGRDRRRRWVDALPALAGAGAITAAFALRALVADVDRRIDERSELLSVLVDTAAGVEPPSPSVLHRLRELFGDRVLVVDPGGAGAQLLFDEVAPIGPLALGGGVAREATAVAGR